MKRYLLNLIAVLCTLNASAQCVASFTTAAAPSFNNLLAYDFTSTSSYGTLVNKQYVVVRYGYGDGTAGFGSNSNHIYAAAGTYTVGMRLRKYDSFNVQLCTDTITQSVTIAYPPCASTIDSPTGNLLTPTRTITATTPAGAMGMNYSWNFGDGTTGSGSPVTHTYPAAGYYTITLTATKSGSSCSYSNSRSTYIQLGSLSCSNFKANYSLNIYDSTAYLSDASSFYVSTYKTVNYDYGDGSGTTTATSHTYSIRGTYLIKQRVTWYDSATTAIICSDSSVGTAHVKDFIYGQIYYDSASFQGNQSFKVYLIQYSPATNLLLAKDSTVVSGAAWIPYGFSSVPFGHYLVKAVCLTNTIGLAGILPTYHDSSQYWNTAQYMLPNQITQYFYHFYGGTPSNIWMRQGIVTAGPGFIGGNVTLGANRGASAAVRGLSMLLRDGNGKMVSGTVTDASGDYSFSNLPAGIYSIYPEAINYNTKAAGVTLSQTNSNVKNVVFHQDDTKKTIAPYQLATPDVFLEEGSLTVAPNPAHGAIAVTWKNFSPEENTIVISDALGKTIQERAVPGNSSSGQELLNLSSLSPGIYFLRVSGRAVRPIKIVLY